MAAKEPASLPPTKKKFLKMLQRTTKNKDKKINRWTVASGHNGHRHGRQKSTTANKGLAESGRTVQIETV